MRKSQSPVLSKGSLVLVDEGREGARLLTGEQLDVVVVEVISR